MATPPNPSHPPPQRATPLVAIASTTAPRPLPGHFHRSIRGHQRNRLLRHHLDRPVRPVPHQDRPYRTAPITTPSQPNTSTFSGPPLTHPQAIHTNITTKTFTATQNGLRSGEVRLHQAIQNAQEARFMNSDGCTIPQISTYLGVSLRTAYRYLSPAYDPMI